MESHSTTRKACPQAKAAVGGGVTQSFRRCSLYLLWIIDNDVYEAVFERLYGPWAPGDARRGFYTALVRETAAAFHRAIPGSEVSVCSTPSPLAHAAPDMAALAAAADVLYIMGCS
jgi:hypothetical protein